MVNHPNRSKPLREINAELLAALKEIAKAGTVDNGPVSGTFYNHVVNIARAAVAKAEGRS